MTADALSLPPLGLLTAAEFAELNGDERYHYELQEGVVMVTNKPIPRHQRALGKLFGLLDAVAADDLVVLLGVSVDLELVSPGGPGFVRAPDLVVVSRAAFERVDREGGMLRARDVLLVVEIRSPSTRRTDRVVKHAEYADAGIGHYWMIDTADGPSLIACHLGGAFGYIDAEPVAGTVATDLPFPARLDLRALV